jgi:pyruvate dehydrogenase E2 component (dihydrolipoamide acetyltransferase)
MAAAPAGREQPAEDVPAAPPAAAKAPAPPRTNGERLFASPLARRVAAERGLDLGAIEGSGPHGRIVLRDVEGAAQTGAIKTDTAKAAPEGKAAAKPEAARPAATAAAAAGGPAKPEDLGYPEGSYDVVAIDSMRRTVARRMADSMRTIPHYYETIDCRIDGLVALRKELNARSKDYRLSVNDFVIRAAALALKRVPEVNASWSETGILRHRHADVAMAVALESGLITPVIREADNLGLAEISRQARDLAKRARDRKLKPEEYQGGTFTISNLGMFGIREFTAVINPPQAAILAVGRAEPRPVVKEGAVAIATMMTCTLSSDHRLIDGAVAARFLDVFQRLVEDPVTMLL